MQPINKIMIYYWDKKLKKRLYVLKADIITINKNLIDGAESYLKWILLAVYRGMTENYEKVH